MGVYKLGVYSYCILQFQTHPVNLKSYQILICQTSQHYIPVILPVDSHGFFPWFTPVVGSRHLYVPCFFAHGTDRWKKMRRSCWVSWAGFPLDRGWILQKLDLQFVDLLAIVQGCFAMSCPWLKLQHHLMKSLFPMLHAGGVPICFCTRLSEQGHHLIVISNKFLGPTSTLSSSCDQWGTSGGMRSPSHHPNHPIELKWWTTV